MNENGFLFVTCVNNEKEYEYCRAHIELLLVPEGYGIDFVCIRGAKSIASGYNEALHHRFKYKIYLHQDTYIINRTILFDLIRLFSSDLTLGMIGVAGCEHLPDNGIWWEGKTLYGKVIDIPNAYRLLSFNQPEGTASYASVAAIDGLLMATQTDIPWRDDLFQGFHFYDIAHSYEMIGHGFKVGVPNMKNPWCIHNSGKYLNVEAYEKARSVFLEHYIKKNKEVNEGDEDGKRLI